MKKLKKIKENLIKKDLYYSTDSFFGDNFILFNKNFFQEFDLRNKREGVTDEYIKKLLPTDKKEEYIKEKSFFLEKVTIQKDFILFENKNIKIKIENNHHKFFLDNFIFNDAYTGRIELYKNVLVFYDGDDIMVLCAVTNCK